MKKTLAEISDLVGGEVVGNPDIIIEGLSSIQNACKGDLTFLANKKYEYLLKNTQASAVIVSKDLKVVEIPHVRTDNPSVAFSKILSVYKSEKEPCFTGVHPTAIISDNVSLGEDVVVGPYVIIENNVTIGDHSIIKGHVYVAQGTTIGSDCMLSPFVSICEDTLIGNNVIIHDGTAVGAEGFGYELVDGKHVKIPQIGIVEIQNDVEIGANVTIDRARFDKTVIGKGTKIDNLVQIAHNVNIGKNCIIVAQVGISGSTIVEKNSILAGQAGLVGHITVGEGSVVAAQSAVMKSIAPKSKVSGSPARDHTQRARVFASTEKLPEYIKIIKDLKKRVEDLEAKNNQK